MAMGSPLSPVVCNIYLETFEAEAIRDFPAKPVRYIRYMDDIFIEWPQHLCPITDFLQHMNSHSSSLRFTIEYETNGCLPFLEVYVQREGNSLCCGVYCKTTGSVLYLNYHSNHPLTTKSGIINTLHRAQTHCKDKVRLNLNEVKIDQMLSNNQYPQHFVKQIKNKQKVQRDKKEKEKPQTTLCIPYVSGLSEQINRIGNCVNIRTVFSSLDTLRSRLYSRKPKNTKDSSKEVVYSIPCSCNKEYIGETGRTLTIRSNIKKQ
jgi:hypothetical protein